MGKTTNKFEIWTEASILFVHITYEKDLIGWATLTKWQE